jgi:hypothetical protein
MLIDRKSLLAALAGFHADLTRFQAHLDRINTLPVPDHDTGTNLLATISLMLVRPGDLGGGESFGNSGMLIGAWLSGAETAILDAPAAIGELAVVAASEVERTIAVPRPGLFLDYAMRAATQLRRCEPGPGFEVRVITDDLRMMLVETALAAPELHQLVDSGSAGLYFLLKRLLTAGPDGADETLFEPWAGEFRDAWTGEFRDAGGADDGLVEFLFTVEGASRSEVLSLLGGFGLQSVMLGRGLDGGIRVHCHGPGYLEAGLLESLATRATVQEFHASDVYWRDV